MSDGLYGRSIKMEAPIRCDACGLQIPKGKYGVQVNAEGAEAQGLFHGKLCYQMALADYREKKKQLDMEEAE